MRKWLLSVLFILPIIVVDNGWIPRPLGMGPGAGSVPSVPQPAKPAPAPHK